MAKNHGESRKIGQVRPLPQAATGGLQVDRGSDDVVRSSLRAHQRFIEKFVGSSSKEIGSSLGVYRKDAESSPGVCREIN
ncbi:hypothetical protein BHM03_00004140 [Ensete ventricosum]|nr:hypothetical protein BHM03_00004140 [Ensete ventricosum]